MTTPPRPPKRRHNLGSVEAYAPTGGPGAAAFFDFDKTLFHGDAGVVFGRTLARWGYRQSVRYASRPRRVLWHLGVTVRILAILAQELAFRSLYYARIIRRETLARQGYRFLKGFPDRDMAAQLDTEWERTLADRMYPEMKAVIDRHRSLGHRIVVVTTSLRPIVELSRRYLGDLDIIACEMEVSNDGVWTGRVRGPLHGAHKAAAIRQYAARTGIDLAGSYAYSDHLTDLEFLAAVGHGVAVNPKRKLRREATRRGWTVLDTHPR